MPAQSTFCGFGVQMMCSIIYSHAIRKRIEAKKRPTSSYSPSTRTLKLRSLAHRHSICKGRILVAIPHGTGKVSRGHWLSSKGDVNAFKAFAELISHLVVRNLYVLIDFVLKAFRSRWNARARYWKNVVARSNLRGKVLENGFQLVEVVSRNKLPNAPRHPKMVGSLSVGRRTLFQTSSLKRALNIPSFNILPADQSL